MKKTKGNLLMGMLMLVVVGAYFTAGTYAKYTSSVEKTGSATVAKWNFLTANTTGTIDLNITPTADASTLVAGKIAPGTSGSFDIDVSNAGSEVGINVSVTIETTNAPTNLKFYSNEDKTTEITFGDPLTGVAAAGEDLTTKTIYWAWAYETAEIVTNDPLDTTDGTDAETMGVTVNITGTQVAPSTTPITTGWN